MNLGTAGVNFTAVKNAPSIFDVMPEEEPEKSFVFINIRPFLIIVGILAGAAVLWLGSRAFLRYYAVPESSARRRRRANARRRRRRRRR